MANPFTGSFDDYLSPLAIGEDKITALACQFAKTYKHLALHSTQQFLPTPISALPTGQEKGQFLSIDVGGSNLRVGFIELLGHETETRRGSRSSTRRKAASNGTCDEGQDVRINRIFEKAWPIREHLKMDNAEDLFCWIGDCIAEVVRDSVRATLMEGGDAPQELVMGITFSFPMMQSSLSEATLMPMGKGFAITSNLNLGTMLLAGYERHTKETLDHQLGPSTKRRKAISLPRLKIGAIANDTVATLASLAYTVKSIPNSRVAMGLIVGTGCNATIPMKVKDLHPSKRPSSPASSASSTKSSEIVINTEWTINGAAKPLKDLELLTLWDRALDVECDAPGFQPFEYMTAGRYLGELVRLIVVDWFTKTVGLDIDALPEDFRTRNQLTTTFLATVVAPIQDPHSLVQALNQAMPAPKASEWTWDCKSAQVVQKAAKAIQVRSAALIAAAAVGLLACAGELRLQDGPSGLKSPETNGVYPARDAKVEELVIAYTGGLITLYPDFKEETQKRIDQLLEREGYRNKGKRVVLKEASDGGIIGAGVLAGTVSNST